MARGNLSPEKQTQLREENTRKRAAARDNLSPEKQTQLREENTRKRAVARDNLSPEKLVRGQRPSSMWGIVFLPLYQ